MKGDRVVLALVAGLVLANAGCGNNGGSNQPTPTATLAATVAPTATASPVPTLTPSPTTVPTPSQTPEPTATVPAPADAAIAKRIVDPVDLIGGPLAVGRVGDFLLANDRVRAVIRDVGRDFSFLLTYGGNIVDADLVRPPGEPGRDNFGAMTPLVNIASTANVQEITIVNDGRNGEPAVIRTLGVDDLLDSIDPVNAIRSFGFGQIPESAQDRDIPVEIMTEYSLARGARSIRIDTTIKNVGSETLKLYVGDYLNGSGQVDNFVPSLGFGEPVLRLTMPFQAFPGYGAAEGVSYGVVPIGFAGGFAQSGVTAYVIGQDVLNIILGQQPGVFEVAAAAANTYTRYFTVGDGDVDSIAVEHYRIDGQATGTVRGRVTVGGAGAAGALISVVRTPGEQGAQFNVLNQFEADHDGHFTGSLPPGDYQLMAKHIGSPYDSGTRTPDRYPITVIADADTEQDIALPATAALHVTVRDPAGAPLPGKATVVGFDPAPDPGNSQQVAVLRMGGFVFESQPKEKGARLFGLTAVHFIGLNGDSGVVPLQPGEYEIVVSHGPEYSIHRERVQVVSGATTEVAATLARVVDTSGFISADYHVHLINSPDSGITRADRILTMLAEGVDYFAATDHDFLTDLRPDIARLGASEHLATVTSAETTTFDLGHFNIWPQTRQPGSISGKTIDWGRAGVAVGKDYPSLGSYDLSPGEIFAAAPENSVVQVNHFNNGTLGYFPGAGIDTALDPPQSFTDPTRIRQDPAGGNLYDDKFTSLEMWIEGGRSQTATFYNSNLGDWFNLFNQGRIKAGTADSDTHSTVINQAGGPRNYVASSTDSPMAVDDAELAASVNDGRLFGSSAPFVRFSVEGDDGTTAGLALGEPKLIRATGRTATVRLHIQSAEWAEFDTIELYANVIPVPVPDMTFHGVKVPRYTVSPTRTLVAGTDFIVQRVVVDETVPGAARFEAAVEVPLTVERDTWVMAIVRGTDGVSKPLWPMNPQDLTEASNTTLDDLTDGNLGEGGNPAFAFTNPLFVDVDGNGRFDPPGTGLAADSR